MSGKEARFDWRVLKSLTQTRNGCCVQNAQFGGKGSRTAQRHKPLTRAHKIRRFRKVELTDEKCPNWCCTLHRVGVRSGTHTGSEKLQLQFTSSSNFSLRSHF